MALRSSMPWAVLCAAMALHCTPRGAPGTTTPMQQAPGAATATLPGTPEGAAAPRPVATLAFVREPTALRRTPSLSRHVEASASKRQQPNVLVMLQRGESVLVLEEAEGFLRVRLSDEQEGFVRAGALRSGDHVVSATCLQETLTFARPDFLAMEHNRRIMPGSLVFVLRDKEAFAEVDAGLGGQATTWVLADALERSSLEVEAAKLLQRARAVGERDPNAALPLLQLLRERFGATRLVRHLVAPLDGSEGAGAEAAAEGVAAGEFDAETAGAAPRGPAPAPEAAAEPFGEP